MPLGLRHQVAILHCRLPFEGEQIITDVLHVPGGRRAHESAVIEDALGQFQRRAPGLSGLVDDMAIRGASAPGS